MAGYSGTPLHKKLGIRPGLRAFVRGAPESLAAELAPLAARTKLAAPLDYVHVFVTEQADLAALFPKIDKALVDDGVVWISWPKKAAKVPTTVDEGEVRRLGLQTSLVDVKVCAVDVVWSGLKFMRRRENRG